MSLTFVAVYRDRDAERLKRSLDSLKEQTCSDFELILVDYGSRNTCSSQICQLIGDYSFCRYSYSDTRGLMWNRSAALNTGARLADGEFLFFTDVDIVYPPWFVQRLLQYRGEDVFFASSCFRCPEGFRNWSQLSQETFEHGWPEMRGKGLMCCARRALERVGGLDEQFGYWGSEDIDLAGRLSRSGLRELELADVYCYHQWHPRVIYGMPISVQFNNLVCYHGALAGARITANERRVWGKLLRYEDRPIYAYLDAENGLPKPNAPIRKARAFGIGGLLTTINEVAGTKDVLWAFPSYDASDKDATFLNKALRRVGWRLDRRLDYAGDVAQGLYLAVPEVFRDCYLNGKTGGRNCAFFLT